MSIYRVLELVISVPKLLQLHTVLINFYCFSRKLHGHSVNMFIMQFLSFMVQFEVWIVWYICLCIS